MSTLVVLRKQPSGQNLVESTKLERIKTESNSKSARCNEKKEKKERRKLKKVKKHEKSSKQSSKKVSDESDQLEKSGLTEELGEPQNELGYLSDGSQNSKKRKRDESPAVESLVKVAAPPVAGNPLRIRLVFKKSKEAIPALPREDLVCSTSVPKPLVHQDVAANTVSCLKVAEPEVILPSAAVVVPEENLPLAAIVVPEENLPSTSGAAIVESKKGKKHKPNKEDRYNALFDDWTPSSICFPVGLSFKDDDDENWLFGNKTLNNPKAAATKLVEEDMSLHKRRSDSAWPKAQFLPQVGIHSLPYTVLF